MPRRRARHSDDAFGNLSFLDIMANSIGAITFIFLMFFIIISGLVKPSAFRLLSDSLPDARTGATYKISLAAAGGTEPYTWSVVKGRLPRDVSLNSRTGLIEGAPAKGGTFRFTLKVEDGSEGHAQTVTQQLVLRVRQPSGRQMVGNMPLEIATGKIVQASVGDHYDLTLAATGGDEPYSWSMEDALPPGLTLQENRLIGTPEEDGEWRLTVHLEDAVKARLTKRFLFTIAPKTVMTEDALEPFAVVTKTLPHGALGKEYDVTLAANGGVPPYSWSIDRGQLPGGLILERDTGRISGKPDRASTNGFAILAADSQRQQASTRRGMRIVIDPIYFEGAARNPLLTWWALFLFAMLAIAGIALLTAFALGVQCPWDNSWRCKSVGKDEDGRTIYVCKQGHMFVNEPRLISQDLEKSVASPAKSRS